MQNNDCKKFVNYNPKLFFVPQLQNLKKKNCFLNLFMTHCLLFMSIIKRQIGENKILFWSFNFFWERLITLTLRKFVALVFLFDLALHKYLIVGVAQIFRNPKQGHSEKSLAMTTVWVEKNILLGSVNSLSLGIIFIGDILRSLQTGKIQSYLWKSIVIGTLLLLLLSWALI